MDEEHTAGYREPCAQCSAVDWGISDECHFFCRACHNIIERTRDVVDPVFDRGSTRISTLSRGSKSKSSGHRGWDWMICEGFQFILMKQADALLRLGVREEFKEKVLCELWRLYLQKSNQAYTRTPVRSTRTRPDSDSESAPESFSMSASETDGETIASSTNDSHKAGSTGGTERYVGSGSVDADLYVSRKKRPRGWTLSMRTTLALIHIGLTWIREPLTLSDLLRLVNEGHILYINAHETLPQEMRVQGKDFLLFRVQSMPSHRSVHKEAQTIIQLLQLPAFPPISRECLLHPILLSVRYLTDANLPDDLHPWICRLMEGAGLADHRLYTFSPKSCPVLPKYDVQAAALIIITMKLFFSLDDHTEWDLTHAAHCQDKSENVFNLYSWYKLLQAALTRAQNKRDQDMARKLWKSKDPVFFTEDNRCVIQKRKRIGNQLQILFENLSSRPVDVEPTAPSSFRFLWGEEDGADGPSMHHNKLTGVVTQTHFQLRLASPKYWHPVIMPRSFWTICRWRSFYSKVEPMLPRTFVWLLQLFSFLLEVEPEYLYEEVLSLERRVFNNSKTRPKKKKKKTKKKRIRSSMKTRSRSEAGSGAPQKD